MKTKLKLSSIILIILMGFYTNSFAQENNIKNLENNIFKFNITQQGIVQTNETAILASRMEEYNVPGVSIALIRMG